jgi:hypothetical protein
MAVAPTAATSTPTPDAASVAVVHHTPEVQVLVDYAEKGWQVGLERCPVASKFPKELAARILGARRDAAVKGKLEVKSQAFPAIQPSLGEYPESHIAILGLSEDHFAAAFNSLVDAEECAHAQRTWADRQPYIADPLYIHDPEREARENEILAQQQRIDAHRAQVREEERLEYEEIDRRAQAQHDQEQLQQAEGSDLADI